MSSVLYSFIRNQAFEEEQAVLKQLNCFFTGLVDILPPECYFDNDTLIQLKSFANGTNDSANSISSKHASLTGNVPRSISRCLELMETNEENNVKKSAKANENKNRLRRKIQHLQAQRKSKRVDNVHNDGADRKARTKTPKKDVRKKQKVQPKAIDKKSLANQGHEIPLFSRFAFMNDNPMSSSVREGRRRLNNTQLLAMAERHESKINSLRNDDSSAARQTETKEAWQKALDKARGKKTKDDPVVLRKLIRKERSLKRRSARKWTERNQQEASKATDRQEKRQRNLDKAKAVRAKARMRKAVQKGHVLPGF